MKFSLLKNKKGQSLVEYMVIVALMGVASIGIVRVLNQTVRAKFTEMTYALRGEKRSIRKARVDTPYHKVKDLSNFLHGVSNKESHSNEF